MAQATAEQHVEAVKTEAVETKDAAAEKAAVKSEKKAGSLGLKSSLRFLSIKRCQPDIFLFWLSDLKSKI